MSGQVRSGPSLNDWVTGWEDMSWGAVSQKSFQSFLQKAIMSTSGMGRDVYSSTSSNLAFPLSFVLFTLPGALRDGFGKDAMLCSMSTPCKFAVLWQFPEQFLQPPWNWSCSSFSNCSYTQSRRCKKFHQTLGLISLGLFFLQLARSMSPKHQDTQHTCTVWTCLQN